MLGSTTATLLVVLVVLLVSSPVLSKPLQVPDVRSTIIDYFLGLIQDDNREDQRPEMSIDFQPPPEPELDPRYKDGDYFEGDLAISQDLIDAFYGDPKDATIETVATAFTNRRWPNNQVIYYIASSIHGHTRNNIISAMNQWSAAVPCLSFVPYSSGSNFLSFGEWRSGCFSTYIGFKAGGQYINLQQPGCDSTRTIMHEIGHAIGYWHEQTRPDRDSYVRINTQNIQSGRESQFQKRTASEVNTQGAPYDYASVMHYRLTAFSKNGQNTIDIINQSLYASQGSPNVGREPNLSALDGQVITSFYSC